MKSILITGIIIFTGAALSCKTDGGGGIDSEAEAQQASKIVFQSLNVSYGIGEGSGKAYTSNHSYESPQGGSVTYTFSTFDETDNSFSYDATFNNMKFTYLDEDNNQQTYTIDGTVTFTFSWDITDSSYSWIYNISSSAITLTGPDINATFPVDVSYIYSYSLSGSSYVYTISASGTVDGIPIDGYSYTYTWSY